MINSIVKNLYRKYFQSKFTYSRTKKSLIKILKISETEIEAFEKEFDRIFKEKSFVVGGAQSVLRDDAFALYVIVRKIKPGMVVETGTYQGYSSHVMIEALKENKTGSFTTCDIEDLRVFPGDFDEVRFKFLKGPSTETFGSINFNETEVFFHDSDHRYPNVIFEVTKAVKSKVKVILCHDFGKDNIHNTIKATDGKGCRDGFMEVVGADYTVHELPTINGVGMAIRKG